MPTFTPPTTDGIPMFDAAKVRADPAHALFRHYGSWEQGKTVWRDQGGVWHESLSPYLGGATYAVHDWDQSTTTGPDAGLATAQVVYLGGHVHRITAAERSALEAAGYASRINLADVEIPHWETEDLARLTEHIMATGVNTALAPTPDNAERAEFRTTGSGLHTSNLRSFWTHEDTDGWTNAQVSVVLDPANYGLNIGPGDIAEQQGIVLRYQQSGGTQTGITLNNNIFFVVPFLNIGVWRSNLDGTGFVNRQFSTAASMTFPTRLDIELQGVVVRARFYQPWQTPPTTWTTVNLDTDAGDAGAIPTPTAAGVCGLISAHVGSDSRAAARFGPTTFRRLS